MGGWICISCEFCFLFGGGYANGVDGLIRMFLRCLRMICR